MIQEDAWIATIPDHPMTVPTHNTPTATFQEFLTNLDEWESKLFSELTMYVDCYNFMHLVKTQNLRNTKVQLLTMSNGLDEYGAQMCHQP
jgi:hypothetical protein